MRVGARSENILNKLTKSTISFLKHPAINNDANRVPTSDTEITRVTERILLDDVHYLAAVRVRVRLLVQLSVLF